MIELDLNPPKKYHAGGWICCPECGEMPRHCHCAYLRKKAQREHPVELKILLDTEEK